MHCTCAPRNNRKQLKTIEAMDSVQTRFTPYWHWVYLQIATNHISKFKFTSINKFCKRIVEEAELSKLCQSQENKTTNTLSTQTKELTCFQFQESTVKALYLRNHFFRYNTKMFLVSMTLFIFLGREFLKFLNSFPEIPQK